MSRIENGAAFGDLGGLNLDNEKVSFAELTAGSWGVINFYRGHW